MVSLYMVLHHNQAQSYHFQSKEIESTLAQSIYSNESMLTMAMDANLIAFFYELLPKKMTVDKIVYKKFLQNHTLSWPGKRSS